MQARRNGFRGCKYTGRYGRWVKTGFENEVDALENVELCCSCIAFTAVLKILATEGFAQAEPKVLLHFLNERLHFHEK